MNVKKIFFTTVIYCAVIINANAALPQASDHQGEVNIAIAEFLTRTYMSGELQDELCTKLGQCPEEEVIQIALRDLCEDANAKCGE
ncbi:MAG: hypothetical protein ISR65_06970 [Bacteriovoracaceae bacterium]|nr:hypothetical protein [Bacteriovoracaceae bacterium]